ncbi:hypothetical protein SLEP1_g51070 [Rubroshorea leprosula]|uniref:Uncharacterized protein n=1 Tax=Rubroshorea leprosula TaxID=152421 RepID=A0AAV5M4G1_9ROSI|nr:hypothetical protein SLEP1_g51070 [Rubroshorea leprosula]
MTIRYHTHKKLDKTPFCPVSPFKFPFHFTLAPGKFLSKDYCFLRLLLGRVGSLAEAPREFNWVGIGSWVRATGSRKIGFLTL